ncbi:MAG: helix-turn-helix transcriptional regulator [Gemmatimonadales bacterium]
MPPTKLQRWLDLIAFLAARRFPITVEQIMQGVPSYAAGLADGTDRSYAATRRMFERDKVELREAGVPIETVEYHVNHSTERLEGYRLSHHDFYLPYLRLLNRNGNARGARTVARAQPVREFEIRENELSVCLEGLEHVRRMPSSPLAEAAASAVRKLTFDLPMHWPIHPTTTLYLDPPGRPDARTALEALSAAVIRRKAVGFSYHGIRRNTRTERRVEPYGLIFRQSRWYLVGRDLARDAVRTFRVSRMDDVEINVQSPRTPDFETPSDFDLDAFASRAAWQLARSDDVPLKARVLFSFPLSLWAEQNGHGELVREGDDGSSVREFEIAETGPFLRWLLPHGDAAVIQLPAELRQEMVALAARVADAHAGEST